MKGEIAKAMEAVLDTLWKSDTNETRSGQTRGQVLQLLAYDEIALQTTPRWSKLMAVFAARFYTSTNRRESTSHSLCQSFTDLFGSGLPSHELFASLKDLPSIDQSTRSALARDSSNNRCHRQWFDGDLAYHCTECAVDPQCAICVECFDERAHVTHHVSLVPASSGFCDCGDRFAWNMNGACSSHRRVEPENESTSSNACISSSHACSPSDEHSSDDEEVSISISSTHSTSISSVDTLTSHTYAGDLASRSSENEIWEWIASASSSTQPFKFPFDSDGNLIDELFPCRMYSNFVGLIYCVCSWLRSLPSNPTRHRKFGSLSRVLSWMRKISRNRTMVGALAFALCQPFDLEAPVCEHEDALRFEQWMLDRCPLAGSHSSTCMSYLFSLCIVPGPVRSTSRLDRAMSEVISTMLSVSWNDIETVGLKADHAFLNPPHLAFKPYLLHALMRNYSRLAESNSTLPAIASVQLLKSSALIEGLFHERVLQIVPHTLQSALEEASRIRGDGSLVIDCSHPALLDQRHYQPKIDCIYLLRQRPLCEAFVTHNGLLVALSALTSSLEGMNPIRRISSGAHVKYESDSWQYAFELEHDIQQINSIVQQYAKDSGNIRQSFWHWRWFIILARLIEQHFSRHNVCDAAAPLPERMFRSPQSFHWPLHRCLAKLWIQQLLVSTSDEYHALCSFVRDAFTVSMDHWWLSFALAPLRLSGCVGEMRAGLWTRNGESVHGSQACYRSPSFATQGATADVAAIQCAAIMASHDETAVLQITHTAVRSFGVDIHSTDTNQSVVDDSAWLVLTSECLSHILSLMCDRTAWISDHVCIRSELVHALATHTAPSHSTLLSSLAESHARSTFTSVIDTALQDLAVFTPARLQHPGHYTMKSDVWSEFNPFYHRYLPHEVAAAELRFKDCKSLDRSITNPRTWIGGAQPHSQKLDWLLCIVHSPALHAVILTVLSAALQAQGAAALTDPSIVRQLQNPVNHSHERTVRAALHLIALAVLTSTDDIDAFHSDVHCDPSSNVACSRCPRVALMVWDGWYDSSTSCTALPGNLEQALLSDSKLKCSHICVSSCRMQATRRFLTTACISLASLRLNDYAADLSRLCARILARQLKYIHFTDPGLQDEFIRSARNSVRTQTQHRQTLVFRAFEQQQRTFLSKHTVSTSEIKSDEPVESVVSRSSTSRVCCLCRDINDDIRPFGQVCLVQRSGLHRLLKQNQRRWIQSSKRVPTPPLRRAKKRKHADSTPAVVGSFVSSESASSSNIVDQHHDNDGTFVLVSCHHLMHVACHAQFLATNSNSRLTDGSFQCPACRRAANVLTPIHDSMHAFNNDQLTAVWSSFVQSIMSHIKPSPVIEPLVFLASLIKDTINALDITVRDRTPPRVSDAYETDGPLLERLEREIGTWRSNGYGTVSMALIRSLRSGHAHLIRQHADVAKSELERVLTLTHDLILTPALDVITLTMETALYVSHPHDVHTRLYQLRCWQLARWIAQFVHCIDHDITFQPLVCCFPSLVAFLASRTSSSSSPHIWHATREQIHNSSAISLICQHSMDIFSRCSLSFDCPLTSKHFPIVHSEMCNRVNDRVADRDYNLISQFLSLALDVPVDIHTDYEPVVDVGFPFSLYALPTSFGSILSSAPSHCCDSCQTPLASLTSLCCLFCGEFVCPSLKQRCVIRHSVKCSAGLCCMLAVKRTDCVLGDCHVTAFCHWPPLYLDQYEDTDINLQRGLALTLNQERLQALTVACRAHMLIPFVKQHAQSQRFVANQRLPN